MDLEGLRVENLLPENQTSEIANTTSHYYSFETEVIIIVRFIYNGRGNNYYNRRDFVLIDKGAGWGVEYKWVSIPNVI